jgi:DNA repair protein RadC
MAQTATKNLFQVNEVELTYRRKPQDLDTVFVKSTSDASEVFRTAWDPNRIDLLEEFKILLLDNQNACLGISHVSTGGINNCLVDPRIVFAIALKAAATQIILAHNHPSGNPNPSKEDIILTQQMVEAGRLLSIKVPDHFILTSQSVTSLLDAGLMP